MKAPILPAHLTDLPRLGGGPVGAHSILRAVDSAIYLNKNCSMPVSLQPSRGRLQAPRTCHHSWTHAMQASGTKSQGSGGRGQRGAKSISPMEKSLNPKLYFLLGPEAESRLRIQGPWFNPAVLDAFQGVLVDHVSGIGDFLRKSLYTELTCFVLSCLVASGFCKSL